MKNLIMLGFFTLATNLFGQEANDPAKTQEAILVAENDPEFPGGRNELYRFVNTNLRYPKKARKNEIEGTVVVSFIIERDGSIKPESIKIEQSAHPLLDEEAIRVVKLMPKWTTASHDGRPVRAKTGFPIKFALK